MTKTSWWPFRGLAARVAGTLAVALLPIGAIAVFQAVQIGAEEQRRLEAALLTSTAEASAGEALAIASASGAVSTLAAHMAADGRTGDNCSDMFETLVQYTRQFSFAGYTGLDGTLQCASEGVGRDMRDGMVFPIMDEQRRPLVLASGYGSISGTSVIVSAAPVYRGTDYLGFVAVSVPHSRIFGIPGSAGTESALNIVTFNADGAVLSADRAFDRLENTLPVGRALTSLVSPRQYAFSGRSVDGEDRMFAVVPIIPGVIYALGSWPRETIVWSRLSPVLFPVLMLIVGLIVAFGAVNALVIRHIRRLKNNLKVFSGSRRIVPLSNGRGMAQELAEIDEAWTDLASQLVHDEAELENMVHEKNVLLKEVHHRVKNNLQLIASIVNLKIRRAHSPEARRTLKEVQGRVMSIASVHRALYSSPSNAQVRADELLRSVIDSTIMAGTTEDWSVEINQTYAPVLLYPDQAVPLLLLASEAVTNALKYIGRLEDGRAELDIALTSVTEDEAMLRVNNTRGTPFIPPDQVAGSGLGRSLIAGFATQVGGTVETLVDDNFYDFRLTFEAEAFDPSERETIVEDVDLDREGDSD